MELSDDEQSNNPSNDFEKILNDGTIDNVDLRRVFNQIKMNLKMEFTINSESDLKISSLMYLQNISSKLNETDFDTKVLFNELISDLIPFMNDHNVLI